MNVGDELCHAPREREFVVVPRDELEEGRVECDRRVVVKDTRVGVAVQVRRNNLVVGVRNDALERAFSSSLFDGLFLLLLLLLFNLVEENSVVI